MEFQEKLDGIIEALSRGDRWLFDWLLTSLLEMTDTHDTWQWWCALRTIGAVCLFFRGMSLFHEDAHGRLYGLTVYRTLAAWLVAAPGICASRREQALNGLLRTIGNALLEEAPWMFMDITQHMRA